jgi:hypothetical protein
MTNNQLLTWATNILAKHLLDNFYGSVTFRIEAGKIINSKTEYTEKPVLTNDNK